MAQGLIRKVGVIGFIFAGLVLNSKLEEVSADDAFCRENKTDGTVEIVNAKTKQVVDYSNNGRISVDEGKGQCFKREGSSAISVFTLQK